MLILTRRPRESINIGDNVTVRVVSVTGQQVHLAIDAPKDVCIWRAEVADRIRAEGGDPTKRQPPPPPEHLQELQRAGVALRIDELDLSDDPEAQDTQS